jgi:uncharacterized membrane protein YdjX (TVP38/TMEM64 family)
MAYFDCANSRLQDSEIVDTTVQPSLRWWTPRHFLLGTGLVVMAALLVWLTTNPGLREAVAAIVLGLREAGPVMFFLAMAVLPAVGFPMMAFTLAAGPVFGPTLGPGWVIAWALLAVLGNLLLSYWLATRALRPVVSRMLAWFAIPLPEVPAQGTWQLALIVRLLPGPPFWVQSYLLGIMRVPVLPYLTISLLVMAGYIVALVLGGDAIARGNGRLAFVAAGILVVVVAVLQLLRQRTLRRHGPASGLDSSPP